MLWWNIGFNLTATWVMWTVMHILTWVSVMPRKKWQGSMDGMISTKASPLQLSWCIQCGFLVGPGFCWGAGLVGIIMLGSLGWNKAQQHVPPDGSSPHLDQLPLHSLEISRNGDAWVVCRDGVLAAITWVGIVALWFVTLWFFNLALLLSLEEGRSLIWYHFVRTMVAVNLNMWTQVWVTVMRLGWNVLNHCKL